MKKILLLSLLLALAVHGQQAQRIAILGTEDDGEPSINISDISYLTDKLREIAGKTLQTTGYVIMTQQSIVDRLGSEEQAVKICKESTCLVDLGRKVNADYVAQARISRFGGNLTIKVELYRVGNGGLIASFIDNSKNVQGLLSILENKAPAMFEKMPESSSVAKVSTNAAKNTKAVAKEPANSFTDARDGKTYKIVKIGEQTWMAENLNYNAKGSVCYDNKPANCGIYGRLYNWATAMNFPESCSYSYCASKTNHRGICPKNWHIPSGTEWEELQVFVGGNKNSLNATGIHLKAKNGWENCGSSSGNSYRCEDTYGFAALPGGYLIYNRNAFYEIGQKGWWWSASENELSRDNASFYTMFHGSDYASLSDMTSASKPYFLSVRCIQDTSDLNTETVTEETIDVFDMFGEGRKPKKTIDSGNTEEPVEPKPPYSSAWYIALHGSGATSTYPKNDAEVYRNHISALLGIEAIAPWSFGFFIGGGGYFGDSLENISEFIIGTELKKTLWNLGASETPRVFISASLGLALRVLWTDMNNSLVAEFIDKPEFRMESAEYLNESRTILQYNFDLMPAIDLQILIDSRYSLFFGYMYRITASTDWSFSYDGDSFNVHENYSPLKNPKESLLGIPGTLRFGVKCKY